MYVVQPVERLCGKTSVLQSTDSGGQLPLMGPRHHSSIYRESDSSSLPTGLETTVVSQRHRPLGSLDASEAPRGSVTKNRPRFCTSDQFHCDWHIKLHYFTHMMSQEAACHWTSLPSVGQGEIPPCEDADRGWIKRWQSQTWGSILAKTTVQGQQAKVFQPVFVVVHLIPLFFLLGLKWLVITFETFAPDMLYIVLPGL